MSHRWIDSTGSPTCLTRAPGSTSATTCVLDSPGVQSIGLPRRAAPLIRQTAHINKGEAVGCARTQGGCLSLAPYERI
jgi:hypothetical protein